MKPAPISAAREEVATLVAFLSELGPGDVLERRGLERRLDRARAYLAELESMPQPISLPVTFKGRPVEGCRSIDAVFASKALAAFLDATSVVTAVHVHGDVADRGRMPAHDEARALRIVDTAVGSFGFELELPPAPVVDPPKQQPLFADGEFSADPYVAAIEKTLELLQQASVGDDDALSEAIASVHPRAASKLRAFAQILHENSAFVELHFQSRHVRLENAEHVRRAVDSLSDTNITETRKQSAGTLLGVLPKSRDCEIEFDDGVVIRAKLDATIADVAELKSVWEGVRSTLTFRVVQVRKVRRFVLVAIGPV
jgi:hypothetical protein